MVIVKILQAFSRIAGPNIDLFLLILMHFFILMPYMDMGILLNDFVIFEHDFLIKSLQSFVDIDLHCMYQA